MRRIGLQAVPILGQEPRRLYRSQSKPPDALLVYISFARPRAPPASTSVDSTENQKIHCGEVHCTGALKVDCRVVTLADELP
jgi:hypothetical protein